MKYLYKCKVISNKQFGFRSGILTNNAMAELVCNVNNKLDKRKPAMAVFLDLPEGLGTVDHANLLFKLNNIRSRGLVDSLVKSFFSWNTHMVNKMIPTVRKNALNMVHLTKNIGKIKAFAYDAVPFCSGENCKNIIKGVNTAINNREKVA